MTSISALFRRANNRPDDAAFTAGGEVWSYRRLATEAERLAQALRSRGLRPGGRVAAMLLIGLGLGLAACADGGYGDAGYLAYAPDPYEDGYYNDGLIFFGGDFHDRHDFGVHDHDRFDHDRFDHDRFDHGPGGMHDIGRPGGFGHGGFGGRMGWYGGGGFGGGHR
jgi:hypothetical protein